MLEQFREILKGISWADPNHVHVIIATKISREFQRNFGKLLKE